ncbi:hypothetical protein JDV02_009894 [Purpureocillium takamizusanense]|uniref:Uncharacterized protein n=1 Tax=Purpureocillium takamizusanense TaxID=2060973 RepID=A0A9Q8QSX6_9HYPO|nr:uncharacterized protein JDV02_009894 [Purpureocillium takamizusanense]UNI24119.1 hypothetical protein JDV02_009894 [Purpureocillium takamizusanense]
MNSSVIAATPVPSPAIIKTLLITYKEAQDRKKPVDGTAQPAKMRPYIVKVNKSGRQTMSPTNKYQQPPPPPRQSTYGTVISHRRLKKMIHPGSKPSTAQMSTG